MKSFLTIALVIASLSSYAGKIGPERSPVSVISDRCDIFYFKVDKQFIGANVEVKNAAGEVIITATVMSHKNIVDFYFEAPGEYVITIAKDGQEVEYVYSKMHPMPSGAK